MATSAKLTFPFSINADNYNAIGIGNNLLVAAHCGDLTPLDRLESQFGGVGYNSDVAHSALQAGNLEFWRKYLLLARWECIVLEEGILGPWVRHTRPIGDIMTCEMGDQMKFEALKIAIKDYLPNLPSRKDFITGDQDVYYVDHRVILPPHRYSIWCLENFTEWPKTSSGDGIINNIMYWGNREIIELLINNGVKFALEHLQRISFRYQPDLYDLVLNNLRPHIDRDDIPVSCRYHSPNDAELLSQIAHAARCAHYREAESLDDLTRFLDWNPELISKLPATVEFFQKVLDGHNIAKQYRGQIAEWFYSFCRSPNRVGSHVHQALQISQNLVERFKDKIDMNVLIPLDFPCMSREDRMNSYYEQYESVEEIPEEERFVVDEYPEFPDHNDDDDYADWVKCIGHDYFEDFLGGEYDEVDSDIDDRDSEYCDEDHEDCHDDEREDSAYYDEENDDYQEEVDYSFDDDIGEYADDQSNVVLSCDEDYRECDDGQKDVECSCDEENGEYDDDQVDEYSFDENCGDNPHESSQHVRNSGCACIEYCCCSPTADKNGDFQVSDSVTRYQADCNTGNC